MRRLIGAAVVVSMLALVACIGSARAQTTTPPPEVIPWDEAVLSWPAPTTFAAGTPLAGASLADCATGPCMVRYIVEASAPGGNGWGPIAVVDATRPVFALLRPATHPQPAAWILTAIESVVDLASEYGEVLTDDVWTFSITDNMEAGGATPKQLPGVISSLSKKKLVKICDEPGEETVGMTDAGATAYVLAVCYDRKKWTRSEGFEAFTRNKEAASKPL